MVLAFVKVMLEKGWNPVERVWVQAQDIDRTAALMCYLQLALWHVPAAVVVGNTIAGEVREVFYTPAHYLGFWGNKLERARREREAAQLMCSTAGGEVQDLVAASEWIQTSSVPMATIRPKPMPKPDADGVQVQFDFEF